MSNDALPLSLLNDYLYCPRRAALKVVEGWREANVHTARGDIVHEHADLPGYEVAKGVTLLRALPVFSERLANGSDVVVELVTFHNLKSQTNANRAASPPAPRRIQPRQASPVETTIYALRRRCVWRKCSPSPSHAAPSSMPTASAAASRVHVGTAPAHRSRRRRTSCAHAI